MKWLETKAQKKGNSFLFSGDTHRESILIENNNSNNLYSVYEDIDDIKYGGYLKNYEKKYSSSKMDYNY